MCPGGLFFTRGLWTTRSCWSTTLLHPFRPFPWPFARAVAASSRKGIRWDRPLLSHPVLDAAELTCIPEALVSFLLLGWECRCLSGLRPGGPAPLSVPVRVCVKAVLVSPGWPSFWTFLNPALCIPVVLLCPGQQPYCGPGITPGTGDTPGLRFWRGDGWCLQGVAAGARIFVSLQLVTSWASVLRWAFRGGWSAGQRRQSPPRGPAEGAGSHSPPAAFLSRQAGTLVPRPLWPGSWRQPHFPALTRAPTSQALPPVSPRTWGLRPTGRQRCRGSLSTSWRRISRHRISERSEFIKNK